MSKFLRESCIFPLAAAGLAIILVATLPIPTTVPLVWRTSLRQASLGALIIAVLIAAKAGVEGYTDAQDAEDEISRGEPALIGFINLPLSTAVCLAPTKDAAPLPLPASATLMGTATNGTYFFWAQESDEEDWTLYRVPADSVTVRTRASFEAKC